MGERMDLALVLPCFPIKDLGVDFHVESLLGGGGFAHVVEARDRDQGQRWALKLMPASCRSIDGVEGAPMLLREARIHLWLSNEPSVLPCMEAFKAKYIDPDTGAETFMAVLRMPVAAYSAMEWLMGCDGLPPSVKGALAGSDGISVWGVWLQMVNAVWRCHARGVVHKDIKLENFMMDTHGRVQLIDFGLAQLEGDGPCHIAGTPWTMSPAGFTNKDDGKAGDWWSLGVVLYQLLQHGAWPFKACWAPWTRRSGQRMEKAIRKAVLAGSVGFKGHLPEPAKQLIMGLLQPDPARRWQVSQVLSSPCVSAAQLQDLGSRFPDLAGNMHELAQIQKRAQQVAGAAVSSRARQLPQQQPAHAHPPNHHHHHHHLLPSAVAHLLLPAVGAGHGGYEALDPDPDQADVASPFLPRRTAGGGSDAGGGGASDLFDLVVHDDGAAGDAPAWHGASGELPPLARREGRQTTSTASTSDHGPQQALRRDGPGGSDGGGSGNSFVGLTPAVPSAALSDGGSRRCSRTSLHELFRGTHGIRPLQRRPSSLLDVWAAAPPGVLPPAAAAAMGFGGDHAPEAWQGQGQGGQNLISHQHHKQSYLAPNDRASKWVQRGSLDPVSPSLQERDVQGAVRSPLLSADNLFDLARASNGDDDYHDARSEGSVGGFGRPVGHYPGTRAAQQAGQAAAKGAEAALLRVVGSFRKVFMSCLKRPSTKYDYESLPPGL